MKNNDQVYISHILTSIKRIEEYIGGIERDDFLSSILVQDGTIRQIEVIGEAIKNLSENLRNRYLQTPWNDIVDMQERLTRNYSEVDLKAVWYFVKFDISALKGEVLAILNDLESEITTY